jgi:hypothetical protein
MRAEVASAETPKPVEVEVPETGPVPGINVGDSTSASFTPICMG